MALQKQTKQKLLIGAAVAATIVLLFWFALSGDNWELLKHLLTNDLSNEELSEQLKGFGWRGYIVIAILSALQVVCTFLIAEPVQILGGFTFGFPIGLLCCMVGVLLGNTLIYMLQNLFGDRLRSFFVKKLNLNLEAIARSTKAVLIIFILYFLPAIPYGMICFLAAGMGMSYRRYILVTGLGALPSVCIGVGLGYMTLATDAVVSLCIFGALVAVLVVMVCKREALFAKLNGYADRHKQGNKNKVQPVNGFVMNLLYVGVRVYLFLCGVSLKTTRKVELPQGPAIVLCNHGSFIDFIYAAALLRRCKPHFIVARLYFYHNLLGWLLRKVGAFPKSMFAMDMESVKNSMTVLKNGEVLAMMPEARLSTAGRFEDIQSGTYPFIKKMGMPVYTVKIHGDYLADPKWGKGFRRGSLVEAELDLLYTAQEVSDLTPEQLQQGIEQRLTYDEFAWLARRPQLHYHSPRMAEGLENVLAVCPLCGGWHTLTTHKDTVSCDRCGRLTALSDRYAFDEGFRFENLAQWYDWQRELLAEQIAADEHYALTAAVELRLPGDGNSLTRHGGQGTCRLTREGLTYCGTKDGETVELHYSIQRIYRLLFGAGENFEIYDGATIHYFVPEDRRTAVDWYMASMILHDLEK